MSALPIKFSIVITCFNYAEFIRTSIESALSQTYPNTELIIVDDGSTDGSTEIIRSYESVATVIVQKNQGGIAAYNNGFRASTGDVVLFLDADDVVHPEMATSCMSVWVNDTVKAQFDLSIIDREGRDLGRRFCHFPRDYDASKDFRRDGTYRWPVTVGNAYARWFLQKSMPLTIVHGPDGHFNTIAPLYGRVETVCRPLGSYRLHGRNAWSSNGVDLGRLPERIAHRWTEIEHLRRHAEALGVPIDADRVLDHELVFINYRLMARKMGLDYLHADRDSTLRLVWLAWRWLARNEMPAAQIATHACWALAMLVCPGSIARLLIALRFNRARLIGSCKKTFNRFAGSFKQTTARPPLGSAPDRRG